MRETGYVLVISSCADKEKAGELARLLVEKRLAACVQLFPIESVYRWQGAIFQENEIALHIKSKADRFDDITALIRENHPYEVPEIIQVPITNGLPSYLSWIEDCSGGEDG